MSQTDKLFDFLLTNMNIQSISKIKLTKIKPFVKQYIQDLQQFYNLSENDYIHYTFFYYIGLE